MYVIQFCKILINSFFETIETFHVNKIFYFMKKHLIFWLTLVGGTKGSQIQLYRHNHWYEKTILTIIFFEMIESGTTSVPRCFTKPNNKWGRLFVTGTEVLK